MTSALWKSPAQQISLLQRALWGMTWWGIPFFGLYALAFRLYAGEPLVFSDVLVDLALSLAAGAVFGLLFCSFLRRVTTAKKDDL